MRDYFLENEKENVDSVLTVAGFSFAGSGQNSGMAFIKLKDWSERQGEERSANAIIGRAMGFLFSIKEAQVFAFNLPPIPELGTATGFDFFLQDRGGLGHEKLMAARNQLLGMAAQDPNLVRVRPNGMEDTPARHQDRLREGAGPGLSIADINNTLSAAWGSSYVNDFVDRGRVKKVYLQADAPFRMNPEDLKLWYVRNSAGQMVPFSAFASTEWSYGSPRLERYNGVSAMEIVGEAAPGKSTGDAMAAIEQMVKQLPEGIGIEWTGPPSRSVRRVPRRRRSTPSRCWWSSSVWRPSTRAGAFRSPSCWWCRSGCWGHPGRHPCAGSRTTSTSRWACSPRSGSRPRTPSSSWSSPRSCTTRGMKLGDAVVEASRQRLRPILMTSLAFIPRRVAAGDQHRGRRQQPQRHRHRRDGG